MKKTRKKVVSLMLVIILIFSVLTFRETANATTNSNVVVKEDYIIVKFADMIENIPEDTNIEEYINAKKADFKTIYGTIFENAGFDTDSLFDTEKGIYTIVLTKYAPEEPEEIVLSNGLTTVSELRPIYAYETVTVSKTEENDIDPITNKIKIDTNAKSDVDDIELYLGLGRCFDNLYDEAWILNYAKGFYLDPDYTIEYSGQQIFEDTTIYADIDVTVIKEVNITVPIPKVGKSVEIEDYPDGKWNWEKQTNRTFPIIPEEANYYCVNEYKYADSYWITGLDDEGYDTPFVGTFEYDTDYYANIFLYTNKGYIFSKDVVITVNGKPVDKIFDHYYDELDLGIVLTTPEEPAEYTILDGSEQDYNNNSEELLTFRADIEYAKFIESGAVYVDDESVDSSNYTSEEGSTIITFNKEYTDSLEAGEHSLKIAVSNGSAQTTFNIVEKTTSNPPTGDNILLFVGLFIVTIIGGYITIEKIK